MLATKDPPHAQTVLLEPCQKKAHVHAHSAHKVWPVCSAMLENCRMDQVVWSAVKVMAFIACFSCISIRTAC